MAGGAERINEGRSPFFVIAWRVNWLTSKTSPPTSSREWFIFPSESLKIRIRRVFLQIHWISSFASPASMPTNNNKPRPISPQTAPSTFTSARRTRCNRILIAKTDSRGRRLFHCLRAFAAVLHECALSQRVDFCGTEPSFGCNLLARRICMSVVFKESFCVLIDEAIRLLPCRFL